MGFFRKKEIEKPDHKDTIHIINKPMNELMPQEKVCFITGGGLGDVLFQCLSKKSDLTLAKNYVNNHFNIHSKMLCVCHNKSAIELFENQLWLSEIKLLPYAYSLEPYKEELDNFKFMDKPTLLNEVHQIHEEYENILLPKELEHVKELTNEPYILVHPFGGQNDRDFSEKDLNEIREANKDKKVYVLGKNYDRISHSIEENPFPNEWIDLIDKVNVRETIELVKNENCKYVYASHSCILMIAWIYLKPNTLYYPENSGASTQIFDKNITPYNFGIQYKDITTLKIIQR
jgi:hypothetical protein